MGVQIYQDGAWGECIGAVFPTAEILDQVDNNCDGVVDEGVTAPAPEPTPELTPEPAPEPEIVPEPAATTTEPIVELAPEETSTSTAIIEQ